LPLTILASSQVIAMEHLIPSQNPIYLDKVIFIYPFEIKKLGQSQTKLMGKNSEDFYSQIMTNFSHLVLEIRFTYRIPLFVCCLFAARDG
jgi:hypothetical protein